MRAVFINHCHPETPHVCATRMREFANAMAAVGHEIILFTETRNGSTVGESVGETTRRLRQHSFSTPLHMDAPPTGYPLLKALRQGRLPWGLRQLVIFWHFWRHKGVYTDWRTSARPYLQVVADEFKPDIIWSTFGGTDCWNIAYDLSQRAKCPWVADIKDLWDVFIPGPFKNSLARHYYGAAALTTFSELHKIKSAPFFPMKTQVLYSGLDPQVMKTAPAVEVDPSIFQISLTGGIYRRRHLETLLHTLARWFVEHPETGKNIRLIYAGAAEQDVRFVMNHMSFPLDVEYHSYLNLADYFSLLKSSHLNMYIRSEGAFHHKIFELMASGRPALCFPMESDEAINLSNQVGAKFYSCGDEEDIMDSLTSVFTQNQTPSAPENAIDKFSWTHLAQELDAILSACIKS